MTCFLILWIYFIQKKKELEEIDNETDFKINEMNRYYDNERSYFINKFNDRK